jgi:predicted PurR-regulated permease PerM
MTFTEKNKAYIVGVLILVAVVALLLLVGEIVLPFVFALFLAYLLNPVILKVQKRIKNRSLAITSLLLATSLLFLGIVVFFGGHIVKDTKRLVYSVETFTQQNEQNIKEIKGSLETFVDDVYNHEIVKEQLQNSDTLTSDEKKEGLMSALESVYSFFDSPFEIKEEQPASKSWSTFSMLTYTLLYTIFILYSFGYFERKYLKYFGEAKPTNKILDATWRDFNLVFISYFKQRAKVVLLNIVIFIIAFSFMDLPGAIIIGIISGLLTYASHFQYLSLPLVAIGCWVLSIENDHSFFLYFGISASIYILVSVLEETVYFDKVMKSVNGMNPAVMLLAFTLWISIFGGFIGTIIALPLTQLIMVYVDRLLMYSKESRKAL